MTWNQVAKIAHFSGCIEGIVEEIEKWIKELNITDKQKTQINTGLKLCKKSTEEIEKILIQLDEKEGESNE